MVETTETENLPIVAERMPERRQQAGIAALAVMSEAEFEQRLTAMRRGRERIQRIHKELMSSETDYGTIPGTNKPTLLKPGAEKLAQFYGFAAEFEIDIQRGDGHERPTVTVIAQCRLHLGDLDGPVVNTGGGAANSFERRYRYRRGERTCPRCGKEGTLLRSKSTDNWFCWAKKGGCGAQFPLDDRDIAGQVVGDVENEDPFDLLNTLLKMAQKRGYVDAILRATATSSLYHQDLEDMDASLLTSQDARQASPEPRTAPPAAAPGPRQAPAAKAALKAAERPLPVSGRVESEQVRHPDDDSPDEEIVVCSVPDCGTILSENEMLGSARRGREFDGRFLCLAHGKEAMQAWKATEEQARALDSELDAKLAEEAPHATA